MCTVWRTREGSNLVLEGVRPVFCRPKGSQTLAAKEVLKCHNFIQFSTKNLINLIANVLF